MTDNQCTIDLSPVQQFNLYLDQYYGIWASEPNRFLSMFEQVRRMDLAAHVAANIDRKIVRPKTEFISLDGFESAASDGGASGQTRWKIAVIDISGTLTKRGSSLSDSGSTIRIMRQLRAVERDPDVVGIILRIDSPGGTVAGTGDVAREVARINQKKPIYAFIEDLAASAAYWVVSQATKVFANHNTALIGSIGTYFGLYDYSGEAEQLGIKAILIRTGEFKGIGFPGTVVTDEHQKYLQGIVDKVQVEFTSGVSKGRGLSTKQVDKLADGRVHPALDALQHKLIDGIKTFQETQEILIDEIQRGRGSLSRQPTKSNSQAVRERQEESPATQPAASKVEANHVMWSCVSNSQIENELFEISQRTGLQGHALLNHLNSIKTGFRDQVVMRRSQLAIPGDPFSTGNVCPVVEQEGASTPTGEAAIRQFNSAVAEVMEKRGCTRQEASGIVAKHDRQLHRNYLQSMNPKALV